MKTNNTTLLRPVYCVLNPDAKLFLEQNTDMPYKATLITPYEIEVIKEKNPEVSFPCINDQACILIKDTLRDIYYDKKEDLIDSWKKRKSLIEDILQNLGAKDFEWIQDIDNRDSQNIALDLKKEDQVNGSIPQAKTKIECESRLEGKYDKERKGNTTTHNQAHSKWKGEYTRESYEKARQIAIETGLINDNEIKGFIDQRNPDHPNPLEERDYEIISASSLIQNIEIGATLYNKLHAGIASSEEGNIADLGFSSNINAHFEKKAEDEKFLRIKFKTKWGNLIINTPNEEVRSVIVEPVIENILPQANKSDAKIHLPMWVIVIGIAVITLLSIIVVLSVVF